MTGESAIFSRRLMDEFASDTGLSSTATPPRRYLWTDAFAVCNFLEHFLQTGDERYKDLALDLVSQVHRILGRHRGDDPRTGWISGLDEQEGQLHPTRGGLRIGKALNERKRTDPADDALEWERDGQYYHYLTKWMHALYCVSRVTGDPIFGRWAVELAETAHARFTYSPTPGGLKRMYWKMSIDLSRPLVASMGQHDPLDGLVIYYQLQTAPDMGPVLRAEIADMETICRGKDWSTSDPLGIGGLLTDAFKVAQFITGREFPWSDLLTTLLENAFQGLAFFARDTSPRLPADYRLAFRELGLSIGLQAVSRTRQWIWENPGFFANDQRLLSLLDALKRYESLQKTIEEFWLDPANRQSEPWKAHRDINNVMLATSLTPDGYLSVPSI